MPVITLTTDLGTRDHYSGAVKGALMKAIPEVILVDISHDIDPFNILHGSFVLKNAYPCFPDGTLHLVGVNTLNEKDISFLIVMKGRHTFIGADNGLFGLLWQDAPDHIFRIRQSELEKISTLPMKDIYVRAAQHVVQGKNPEAIADKVSSYRQSALGLPLIDEHFIRCSVIYFDRFENAILNVTKEQFEIARKGRRVLFHFKRYDDVSEVSESYYSVAESEKLVLINSIGYLEIAINKGNAKGLLNLSLGDFVQIEFK